MLQRILSNCENIGLKLLLRGIRYRTKMCLYLRVFMLLSVLLLMVTGSFRFILFFCHFFRAILLVFRFCVHCIHFRKNVVIKKHEKFYLYKTADKQILLYIHRFDVLLQTHRIRAGQM